jgi:DNA (cytosine-5)-methyltransferase 1
MRVLDLFSGIGGFSLGLERAGFETVAFCEFDAKARKVLAKHWPNVPIFDDVRTLSRDLIGLMTDEQIDVICGGFPCQDISVAGKGAGLAGARSGLWSEFARLIGEIRPAFAIVENVSALRARGLEQVLGALTALGYDAEWHCIPASAVGAPHRRDRVWIVAYTDRVRESQPGRRVGEIGGWTIDGGKASGVLSDADDAGRDEQRRPGAIITELAFAQCSDWWAVEPDVGRMANGVPARVDRLRQLGNAVVPQIPELLGRAIMRAAG